LLNFCQFDFELLRELFFIGKLKIFYYHFNLSHSYVASQSYAKLAEVYFSAQKRLKFAKLLKKQTKCNKFEGDCIFAWYDI